MLKLALTMLLSLVALNMSMLTAVAADRFVEPVTGMEFVRVPGGCFAPGDLSGRDRAAASAKSAGAVVSIRRHGQQLQEFDALDDGEQAGSMGGQIRIDGQLQGDAGSSAERENLTCIKSFWMAKYEVTQEQYRKITGSNPSAFNKGGSYPVERVRWFDARKFIRLLNRQSSKQFRLPSEAEWEYAARSGGRNQFYSGGNSAAAVAWYMGNSGNSTHPAGQKRANALGLYDMSGNVWEWTADCWNESVATLPKDGAANKTGNCTARVLRGGSWYDAKELIRTTSRLWNDNDRLDNNSGFRLVFD